MSGTRAQPKPPTVLIYRSGYNQLSETFVRDHVHGLRRFTPLVLTNRVDPRGPAVTAEIAVVPTEGRVTRRLWQWGLARRVDRLLRTQAPALIHAHFLTDGARIMPYAQRHGIPLIVTAHGYDATLSREEMAKSADGRLLLARETALKEQATMILCVSDFIRDEMLARGWPSAKLVTHPLGVDTAALAPAPAAGRRGIVTIGRLVEKKGTRFLIDAYARLPDALRAAHPLTIIGDGPLRAELEAQAAALGIAVNLVGGQPRERVFGELPRAAVFCLPSVRAASGDAEGMPIAIMEALAFATPTLIFDDQPAAALFVEQGAGAVARARDAGDLAAAMTRLLDPAKAAMVGANGRVLAERMFDLTRNNAALEQRYADVLAAQPS